MPAGGDFHAIVSGTSRGLGEALALALLERGAAVTGIGRADSPRLTAEHYRFVACDLADTDAIEAIVEPPLAAIAKAKPRFVCLVNNAAVATPIGRIGALDARELRQSMAVNLIAPILLANVFCRVFSDATVERRIINISSGAAETALTGGGAYSIAKSGLEMLTRTLAGEQHDASFAAITLRPGIIDTGMQAFMRSRPRELLPSVALFQGFHRGGQLVAPDVCAGRIVERLVLATVEHGRSYNYREL